MATKEFAIKDIVRYGKMAMMTRAMVIERAVAKEQVHPQRATEEQCEAAALITLLEQIEAAGTITTIVVEVGEEVANV